MSLQREFTGFENRPFAGTIAFRNADGSPAVLAGTYQVNLYRQGESVAFASGTVAGGELVVTGAAGTIAFLFASGVMTSVVGFGSAEVIDTAAGSRVITIIPARFLPMGTVWQPEFGETLVIWGNSAVVTVTADLSAGTAIVTPADYGDIDVTGGGLIWNIKGNVVGNAELRDAAALSVIGRSTNSSGDPADIIAANGSDAVLREQGGVLGFGAIATGGIANNAVTDAKLRTSAALSIIGRSANSTGNVADIIAVNGSDAVLREQGGVLGFGAIATGGIANNAVTDAKLRTSAALSIVGRSANSTGNVADIVATADGQYLGRRASALGWFQPTATEIANTPAGGIAAATVQAAINELDSEKLDKAGGTISGNLTITGNLTLNGTTYQVNATTVTYDDIILMIGGDTAPVTDDAKDRGIEFRWHNGSTAKIGYFGWDRSTQEFAFIPDATDTADVLSGADGTFRGNLNGNAGTASKWAVGRTISLTGHVTGVSGAFDGSGNLSFATTLNSFTMAQLDAAVNDGNVSFVGHSHVASDVSDFTEATQDVIGALFASGTEFTFTYNDAANSFAAALTAGGVANSKLANMAAHTIKANVTGGAAAPQDKTLSELLDAEIGSTQGIMMVRTGTGWAALGAGATAGQVPTSQGAGADWIMATPAGGGGGSPGGTNGQIQYNNAGVFAGFTVSGDVTVNTTTGVSKVNGATEDFALKGIISPAQITAQQNDYAPAGLATATVLRLSSDNDGRALTGLVAQNSGSLRVIENVGNTDLLLYHEHTGSAAANRFDTGGPAVVIAKGGVAILKYDGTSSRWRVLSVQGDGQSRAGNRRQTTWFADFLAAGTTMNPPFTGAAISSGTSSISTFPSNDHPGLVGLISSSTANSGYRWQTDANSIGIRGGEVFECVFFVNNLTNTTTRMGFHDATTSTDAVDGAYIELPAGSGAAVLKTSSNSTRTPSSTIATLTTSNWYRAVISVNRDATSVTAEIFDANGVSLGSQSNTTNIPVASGRETQVGIVHTNSGTTAITGIVLDYLAFRNGEGKPSLR